MTFKNQKSLKENEDKKMEHMKVYKLKKKIIILKTKRDARNKKIFDVQIYKTLN